MKDKKQVKKVKKTSTTMGKGKPPAKGPTPVAPMNPAKRFSKGGMVKGGKSC